MQNESAAYIVMAPNAWGKADTIEQAKKNCRKVYGSPMKDYDVYRVHPDTTVDGMGGFSYPAESGRPTRLHKVRKGKELDPNE